jgi:hypothetical protein
MKILGYEYEIKRGIAANNSVSIALCDNKKQEIVFTLDELKSQVYESVIIHEVIEALNYLLELNLTHPQIMGMEAGLKQVLTDAGVDLSPLLSELTEDGG